MANILDKITGGLYEAAFGDVRNIFNNTWVEGLMGRPIGLIANSYEYMIRSLRRNIGNSIHSYDGFGTAIGDLANQFYNSFIRPPWFFIDGNKNSTANYLEYIRAVYGSTLNVMNINEDHYLKIMGDNSPVGVVQTNALYDAITGEVPINVSLVNPNGSYSDTTLGVRNTFYLGKTLHKAIVENDARNIKAVNYGITENLKYYFGLKTESVLNHDLLTIESHYPGESFLSNDYYTSDSLSPVYNSNYGKYNDIGIYRDYVLNLSNDSLYHFRYNSQINVTDTEVGRVTAIDAGKHDGGIGLQYGRKYLPTINDNYFKVAGIKVQTPDFKQGVEKDENGNVKRDKNGNEIKTNDIVEIITARYIFTNDESTVFNSPQGGIYVYSESENGKSTDIQGNPFNSGIKFGIYSSYNNGDFDAENLLKKTNIAFKKGQYDTLIARFKTGVKDGVNDSIQTAVSKDHGMSHGRNLLKRVKDDSQGYENRYCRVWTYHHQYSRLADSIRPFQEKDDNGTHIITQEELYNNYGFKEFSADHSDKEGFENGRARLGKYGVLNQKNGLVNITPIDSGDENKKVNIKNCMFSIENLAWKGSFSQLADEKNTFQNGGLSSEQKGPFGGRIMWFPPYGLKFNETVNVDWSQNNFIGRGESIYTYKNTTRAGQLSFKLLIDHPSIINYWENRGKSVSNSVDDIDDPEQQLLRFFAGCELLSSKSAETKKTDPIVEYEPRNYPKTDVYTFFVFFPNDYSGMDNDADFAADYLTNGIGTWNTIDGRDYNPAYSKLEVELESGWGGYEVRPGRGISYLTERLGDTPYIATVKYGSQSETELYAQVGTSDRHDWDSKWYYRIDKNKINEKLKSKENYFDVGSFSLNTYAGKTHIIPNFDISDYDKLFGFTDMFVALTESRKNSREVLNGFFSQSNVEKINSNIIKKKNRIKEIVCIGQASIQGNSSPESENVKRNKELANQRAATIQKWLRNYLPGVNNIKKEVIAPEGERTKDDVNSLANKLHRCVRVDIYVECEESDTVQNVVKEQIKDDTTVHPINPTYPARNGAVTPMFIDEGVNPYYDPATLRNKEMYSRISSFSKGVDYLIFNAKNSIEGNSVNLNGVFNGIANFAAINAESTELALRGAANDIIGGLGIANNNESSIGDSEINNFVGRLNPFADKDDTYAARTQELVKIKRYDNESKFFEMLEVEEPFLHHKISDKVKYFDPAFHSISPEGFNARLTFLQQCSRQGPTCGSSDTYTKNSTANNLAFGRPPVCILRIGDFYYTKIIIDSITIDFGDVMWDLNAEGIGVMPMIADINISFKYIGGSSLSGPISRLQNALSFNAYANTEVYDNRAELAEYDGNGNLTKFGTNPIKTD